MPGTLLRIAVSITVEPTSPSTVRAVPLESVYVILGIWRISGDYYSRLARGLYIVIRTEAPSLSTGAQQSRNLDPHLIDRSCELIHRLNALAGREACSRFCCGGGPRDPTSPNSEGRPFQGVCKGRYSGRLASTHAIQKKHSLALEELQDFPLEPGIIEGHACQVRAIENRAFGCHDLRCLDCQLEHPGVPSLRFQELGLTAPNSGK